MFLIVVSSIGSNSAALIRPKKDVECKQKAYDSLYFTFFLGQNLRAAEQLYSVDAFHEIIILKEM